MATQHSRSIARLMMAPAVVLLLGWMLVPLTMTLFFSFKKYLPLRGGDLGWVGFENYVRFVSSSSFWPAVGTTLLIVGGVLVITVLLGIALALLLDQPIWGQGIVRILVIAPFFVMPTVSGLVWKNMFMDPVNGFFAHIWRLFGAEPIQWLSHASMPSLVMIISWQWLPFATLILLTAIQSLDSEQLEAAEMDGARPVGRFWFITLPHLARAITVVILIQTIFLLHQPVDVPGQVRAVKIANTDMHDTRAQHLPVIKRTRHTCRQFVERCGRQRGGTDFLFGKFHQLIHCPPSTL